MIVVWPCCLQLWPWPVDAAHHMVAGYRRLLHVVGDLRGEPGADPEGAVLPNPQVGTDVSTSNVFLRVLFAGILISVQKKGGGISQLWGQQLKKKHKAFNVCVSPRWVEQGLLSQVNRVWISHWGPRPCQQKQFPAFCSATNTGTTVLQFWVRFQLLDLRSSAPVLWFYNGFSTQENHNPKIFYSGSAFKALCGTNTLLRCSLSSPWSDIVLRASKMRWHPKEIETEQRFSWWYKYFLDAQ